MTSNITCIKSAALSTRVGIRACYRPVTLQSPAGCFSMKFPVFSVISQTKQTDQKFPWAMTKHWFHRRRTAHQTAGKAIIWKQHFWTSCYPAKITPGNLQWCYSPINSFPVGIGLYYFRRLWFQAKMKSLNCYMSNFFLMTRKSQLCCT